MVPAQPPAAEGKIRLCPKMADAPMRGRVVIGKNNKRSEYTFCLLFFRRCFDKPKVYPQICIYIYIKNYQNIMLKTPCPLFSLHLNFDHEEESLA